MHRLYFPYVQVFSVDVDYLKGHCNGVILTLFVKTVGDNIIYVAIVVCPIENADSCCYLHSKAVEFDGLRKGLKNTSYMCF